MLPKLNNCIDAIENGVSRVHIFDGRIAHCLLLGDLYQSAESELPFWEMKDIVFTMNKR